LPNLAKSSCEWSPIGLHKKNWWTIHNQGFYFYFYFFHFCDIKIFGVFFSPKKLQKIVEITLGKFIYLCLKNPKFPNLLG
jgi:hypothetical protein